MRVASLLLTVLSAAFCAPVSLPQHPDTAGADFLWVPTQATVSDDGARPVAVKNGRSVYVDGSSAVGFTLIGEREALSSEIVRHYTLTEWRRRDRE
jgi:hypothetical protein